jgi:hypothetical protein
MLSSKNVTATIKTKWLCQWSSYNGFQLFGMTLRFLNLSQFEHIHKRT